MYCIDDWLLLMMLEQCNKPIDEKKASHGMIDERGECTSPISNNE